MACVVIYDSGVGGLSIYNEVVKQCPGHDYVFVSDNQAFPYGTKAQAVLTDRVMAVVTRIDEHYAPDILVVACNTASTVVLPALRERFSFDIVGVVPAIKPAAKQSQTQHIGVLATPATIARDYTAQLIKQFAADCRVTTVGSSALVEIAEAKLYGRGVEACQIEAILAPFLECDDIDILVLACTHFPLLNKEISNIFKLNNKTVLLLDSAAGIAKRVSNLIEHTESVTVESGLPIAVLTKSINQAAFLDALDNYGFSALEVMTV